MKIRSTNYRIMLFLHMIEFKFVYKLMDKFNAKAIINYIQISNMPMSIYYENPIK